MEKFIKYSIKPIANEINDNHGQFEIGPLESGFGITIGNALRRVILSNIPGASVFAIKIPGVNHEFQAIDGIKEDVTQIILNLKQLVLKISEEAIPEGTELHNWPTMKISFKDSGVIKAEDIELPVGFEVVNPDLYIATKTKASSKFEMEIFATNGRGFRSFKENQESINTLSIIATDSNFCPVLQVGYHVDERKISKNHMGDYLTLDVVTNGAVSPTDAVAYASKILVEHFEQLAQINERIAQLQMMKENEEAQEQAVTSVSIDDLELSVRSYNCLKRSGIRTIQELSNMTRAEVEKIKNLGKTSLREIRKKLTDYGLSFKKS
ncbi:MAG: DNA-directed RNA polymerase subunit alpha [Mycoplasmoidaceae bacterium]